jgi:hypothetical protein
VKGGRVQMGKADDVGGGCFRRGDARKVAGARMRGQLDHLGAKSLCSGSQAREDTDMILGAFDKIMQSLTRTRLHYCSQLG